MSTIRVALAEDNVLLREGVARLVSAQPDFEIVGTQATLLAIIGLAFGIPLGLALGRILWHAAANTMPLALVAANLLAAWPARRAARLRTAQILRTE